MLIDVSNLDYRKIYHGNEVGTGTTSKILQELQSLKYPNIPVNELATHSFIFYRKNNNWFVFENHIKWGGVKEMTLEEYELDRKKDSPRKVIINPYWFDRQTIEYLKNNNPTYSVLDLGKIAANRLMGIKLPNTKGQVCSETAANCGLKICNVLKIKSENICPADWQMYFINHV